MMNRLRRLVLMLAIASLTTLAAASQAAETTFDFFESRIRPALVEHCYSCHSSNAKTIKADYLLDTRDGIRKGGASGRDAVIPGDVEGSQLIAAIRHSHDKLKMPPKSKLPDSVIADFEQWIATGAPDPRDGESRLPREIVAENHWAWKRPVRHEPPGVANVAWPNDPLDNFVLAKLEATGMSPNPDADRRTLIRRATLELTGLPPEVADIADFLDDSRDNATAFAAVVDRLLADTGFGVRWGRHWLDVARYGESSGYSRNMLFPYAWRYRNWVIDSFNADKPFNRFVREQIAGDLLPAASPEQRDDQVLGTAFLTVGAKTFNEGNALLFNLNCADDQIDATCRAFLALTANCARCHDHKYDPIPTRDYYAMAGVFLSSRHLAGSETNVRNEHSEAFPLGPNGLNQLKLIAEAQARYDKEQAFYLDLVKKRNTLRAPLVQKGVNWRKNPTPELADAEAKVQAQQDVVRQARNAIPPPPQYAMAMTDGLTAKEAARFEDFLKAEKEELAEMKKAGKKPRLPTPPRPRIQDSPLYEKGLHDSPLESVPRGALGLFDYPTAPIGPAESGRRQLADWITDTRNPLTARVYVNRVWHHLFGKGLVETVDNFGALGAPPSHPKLLDALALDFMNDGWSTKRLIRRVLLSRTWRQSSAHNATNAKRDPDSRLLWRFPPQLLEGEAIRDGILAISGRLDQVHLQTSQVAEISKQQALGRQREIGRRDYYTKDVTWNVNHRSVYLPMPRGMLPDVLATFDAADPNLVVGARKLTIVPTQALYLANSSMVIEESESLAARISSLPEEQKLNAAYEFILGRLPDNAERKATNVFRERSSNEALAWTQICQTLICSGEFRTVY